MDPAEPLGRRAWFGGGPTRSADRQRSEHRKRRGSDRPTRADLSHPPQLPQASPIT
jgi:hypothetical protein